MDDRELQQLEMREKAGPMLATIAIGFVLVAGALFLFVGVFSVARYSGSVHTAHTAHAGPIGTSTAGFTDAHGTHTELTCDNGFHHLWVYIMTDTAGDQHVIFGVDSLLADSNHGGADIRVEDMFGTSFKVDKARPKGSTAADLRIITPAGLVTMTSPLRPSDVESLCKTLDTTKDGMLIESMLLAVTDTHDITSVLALPGTMPSPGGPAPTVPSPGPAPPPAPGPPPGR